MESPAPLDAALAASSAGGFEGPPNFSVQPLGPSKMIQVGANDDWSRQSTAAPDPLEPALEDLPGAFQAARPRFGARGAPKAEFGAEAPIDVYSDASLNIDFFRGGIEDDLASCSTEQADEEPIAVTAAMRERMFQLLDEAVNTGALEGIFRQLASQISSPPGRGGDAEPGGMNEARLRWSWPPTMMDEERLERSAIKQELKTSIFDGLERALDSSALEEAFREIAMEQATEEAADVRAQYASLLWSAMERALLDGSLEATFGEIAEEHAAEDRAAVKKEFCGPIFASLARAIDDGSLERGLAELSLQE